MSESDPRALFRAKMLADPKTFVIKKPDPDVTRDLEFGWLLHYLLPCEDACWGRWEYWCEAAMFSKLPDRPIPRIDFLDTHDDRVVKMLDKCLDAVTRHGEWRGWGSSTYFRYFLDWLLFGLGDVGQKTPPAEPSDCAGASDRLYQIFNAGLMLLCPYDYFGFIASEMRYGRGQGFFPTPHSIVKMMTMMTMDGHDCRAETVCDPAVGTGRLLLEASNYSMRLYGQDISAEMVACTKINAYLYAPWMARPLGWLEDKQRETAIEEMPVTATEPEPVPDKRGQYSLF